MTTAIYVRTSTDDQTGEAQLSELRRIAPDCQEYIETEVSGSVPAHQRPMMKDLINEVRRGRIGEIVVFALDRLGRNTIDVLMLVDELGALGCRVRSLRDGTIDPSTPMGRFALTLMAASAEMERSHIRERVKSGMAARRAKGLPMGRARRHVDMARLQELRKNGKTWREIAIALKTPSGTLRRLNASVQKVPIEF